MSPQHPHPTHPPAPAWRRLVDEPQSPCDVDAITETVDDVLSACSEGSFELLDFSRIDPLLCSAEHLAAALRASSYFCDHIPSWPRGLEIARFACAHSGADPDDLLFGMS